MSILYATLFYILAVVILASTALAITRRNVVHAVVYGVISFIAVGVLFYLLGAPFVAGLQVIIYAGAIMVFFLFIVMMLRVRPSPAAWLAGLKQWLPAIIFTGISFTMAIYLVWDDPGTQVTLKSGMAGITQMGHFVFRKYWFAVEIASYLLLIALVGALYLGRGVQRPGGPPPEEKR
jgi:NADH-quinone oxidoreductase subunit J